MLNDADEIQQVVWIEIPLSVKSFSEL